MSYDLEKIKKQVNEDFPQYPNETKAKLVLHYINCEKSIIENSFFKHKNKHTNLI